MNIFILQMWKLTCAETDRSTKIHWSKWQGLCSKPWLSGARPVFLSPWLTCLLKRVSLWETWWFTASTIGSIWVEWKFWLLQTAELSWRAQAAPLPLSCSNSHPLTPSLEGVSPPRNFLSTLCISLLRNLPFSLLRHIYFWAGFIPLLEFELLKEKIHV